MINITKFRIRYHFKIRDKVYWMFYHIFKYALSLFIKKSFPIEEAKTYTYVLIEITFELPYKAILFLRYAISIEYCLIVQKSY